MATCLREPTVLRFPQHNILKPNITVLTYHVYHTTILCRVSYCLFKVPFYPFDISKESWLPYLFDLEKAPFVDGVKVDRKIKIHTETALCTPLLGYTARFWSIERLWMFNYSFSRHLSNLLNWQDCSGLPHAYLLLPRALCIWLLQGEFHSMLQEQVIESHMQFEELSHLPGGPWTYGRGENKLIC